MICIETLIRQAADRGDGLSLTALDVQAYAAEFEARDAEIADIVAEVAAKDREWLHAVTAAERAWTGEGRL